MPNMENNPAKVTTFGGVHQYPGRAGPGLRGPGPGLGRNPSRDERYILEWGSHGLIDWTETLVTYSLIRDWTDFSGDLQP